MKFRAQKTSGQKFADHLTRSFGTIGFLVINLIFFSVWLVINLGWVVSIEVFDPFPFNLLTTFVSLEAIFLSVIVLISQNKAEQLASIREQVDFEVNVESEREVTRIIKMLDDIQHYLKMNHKDDPELKKMKRDLNLQRIEKRVAKEIE